MRYPCLVPSQFCKTVGVIHLESEELNECGEPEKVLDISIMGNYQSSAKTVLTAEKKLTQMTGYFLVPNDFCPEFPTISSGTIEIFGEKRIISGGSKLRNPDGTVNYCRIEVL